MRIILSLFLFVVNIVLIFFVEDTLNIGDPRAKALAFFYYMIWMSICMIISVAIFIFSSKLKILPKLLILFTGFGIVFMIQIFLLDINDSVFNNMLLWGFFVIFLCNISLSICWTLFERKRTLILL